MGQPHRDTWPIYRTYFKVGTDDEVRELLGDDLFWLPCDGCYRGNGGVAFPNPRKGEGLSCAGVFSDCESVAEVDAYPWPDPAAFDFGPVLAQFRAAGDRYRAGGMWSPFFHLIGDMFGMENYFIKMYTAPEVVKAVTRHIVDFYLAGTERFIKEAGEDLDAFFFGNDFGTQRDIMISPECFEEFIFPYFRELTDLGHAGGKQVVLHSCGAIAKVIPSLIDLGVDMFHPLQAAAANMNAESLARFKGQVAFCGGIDTQHLLIHGTPDEVRADVRRVRSILGPCLVISPSHEALLPNVPPQNVAAMAEAAHQPYQ
ncbi:MAG: uroporphyrinogen decarboxylase family protein [Victivallaceae bacterium]